jgi:acetyl-CoA carboxylase biotin carboxyl carrier protein
MTELDPDPPAADRAAVESLAEQARALVERLEGTSVRRLSVQAGDCRIEIERGLPPVAAVAAAPAAVVVAPADAAGDGAAAVDEHRHAVTAPLVGRFFRAPQPGAAPFVEPDDVVEEAQTVCIVEAMKMMNEVVASEAGKVVEITAENGGWCEFEQVLMYLEPTEA